MTLPSPETCLAYADAFEKQYRDVAGGTIKEPGEPARAAAAALRFVAELGSIRADRDALAAQLATARAERIRLSLQVSILTNERDTAVAKGNQ